jgi:hypothetical protein
LWIWPSYQNRVLLSHILIPCYTAIIYHESESFPLFSCHNQYGIFVRCPNWRPVWWHIFRLSSAATGRHDRKLHDPSAHLLRCLRYCPLIRTCTRPHGTANMGTTPQPCPGRHLVFSRSDKTTLKHCTLTEAQFKSWIVCCFIQVSHKIGARGSVVVKALCYKSEGRRFDIRWDDF